MITQKKLNVNELTEFSKHKKFAQELQSTLANFYKDPATYDKPSELTQKGLSILNCGNTLQFERFKDPDTTTRLASANFCKHRLCPFCAWRWHLKYSAIIERTFEILNIQNFYHLVLTIPNVKFLNKEFLINLRQNATIFMKKVLKCQDYMISFEITISEQGTFHPHFHIICILDKVPTKKFLQTEWAKVSNCGNYAICNIKQCENNKISKELTKYILKFESDKINNDKIFIINKALKGLRKFATNGKIKNAETQAKQQLQKETFDKIQNLQQYDSELLFYEWLGNSYSLKEIYQIDKSKRNRQISTGAVII